jgi:hypothetical protein
LKFANDPEPPEEPSPDEQRDLNRVLRTFGSKAVADAYEEFVRDPLGCGLARQGARGAWGVGARPTAPLIAGKPPCAPPLGPRSHGEDGGHDHDR